MPEADRHDEVTNAWRRYLTALAKDRPAVVWIDDLHWADPQLVALIDRLTLSGTSPLLIVATARPEFAQQAGLRPTGQRFFIDLEPLGAEEAQRLASLAGGAADPITSRAEGNPLFIIELVRARARLDSALPMTLRGAIGARLDDLVERDRQLLQAASVVGELFTARDAAVLVSRDPGEVRAALDHLVERQYVRVSGDGAYRFHHGLVREVAYGQLPIAERLRLHARYAREGLPSADDQRRAYHLWEAVGGPDAAWVWEDPAEHAALRRDCREALIAAARADALHFLHDSALTKGTRALSLADSALDRAAAHQVLGESHAAAVAGDQAWEHLSAALAAYAEAGVPAPPAVYATIADFIWKPGGFTKLPDRAVADRVLREGLEAARSAGDGLSEARILTAIGFRARSGDERRAAFARIGTIVDRAVDPLPFVDILSQHANSEGMDGNSVRSMELLETAETLMTRGRQPPTDIFLYQLTTTAFGLGDLAAVERTTARYETAVASAGPHVRVHPHRGRAWVALARGDWPTARILAREVSRTMDEHPETVFCVASLFTLTCGATGAAMTGDLVESRELLARAKTLSEQPNVPVSPLGIAYAALGRLGELGQLADAVPAERWVVFMTTALAMAGDWDRVESRLAVLDRHAAGGTWLAGALAAGVREERSARSGGPRPAHAALREKGYVGFSELLSRGRTA